MTTTAPDLRRLRPPRREPPAQKVAAYWAQRGGPFTVHVDMPACFACFLEARTWSRLQRAHLVDRARGGLDGAQNLAMLCPLCHRVMPVFRPGQEQDAIQYILDGGYYPLLLAAGYRNAGSGVAAGAVLPPAGVVGDPGAGNGRDAPRDAPASGTSEVGS